ncbi:MAG: efflux transporter outer membrane subunit [bacterium]
MSLLTPIIVVFLVLGLAGCATRTVDSDAKMDELPESFSGSGKDTLTDKWWTELDDSHLNKLMKRALDGNLSLKQAWNRLDQARASVSARSADLYPGLNVSGDITQRRQETSNPDRSQTATSEQLKAVASYEVDLWNRIESSVEAARYSKKASREQLKSAAVSLSAEVAHTWYQLVDSYNQVRILRNQLEVNQNFYSIVSDRYEYGRSQRADVLRQRRLKDGTKERLLAARSRSKTLEHKLAVLLGQSPKGTVNPVVRKFPDLPPIPETGIPSKVINRRPDVRASFRRVQEADRNVASAIANQYPRLNLTGAISTSGGDSAQLFENWLQSLTAELTAPILDAGKRRAEVRKSEAILSKRINSYKESVLTAFREVEDSLVQERHQRKQLNEIKGQLKAARETVTILRNQYANGTTDFLSVLEALKTKHQLQLDLARARRKLIIDRIGLYRSLSGGWSLNRPESNNDKTAKEGA